MSTSAPLRRDAERNRQRILSSAQELFAERGLEVSLDDIAGHAGVGVGTVYRRFASKDALIDELFETRLAEIEAIAREALEIEDPWEALVEFMERLLASQAADRGLKQVAFCRGAERVAEIRQRISPIAGQLIDRARDAGELRDDVVQADFPLLNGAMISTVMDATRELDPQVYRRYLTIVLDGLRAKRDAPTPLPAAPLEYDQVDIAMQRVHGGRPRGA